jgi:uncharacterized protein (TIGR02271 family)
MNTETSPVIYSQEGLHGRLDPPAQILDGSQPLVTVLIENRMKVAVPVDLMERQADGSYRLLADLAAFQNDRERQTSSSEDLPTEVLPVLKEELEVTKRTRETGRVRVHKQVHEQAQWVNEPGYEEQVEISRVPVNRELSEPISTRREGETLIVPVMEEVLVIEKRLILKEELHITKRRKEIRNPQRVVLRREEASVERIDEDSNP